MSEQDLPDIGECVIATYRCGLDPRVFHAFFSREDDYEGSIVWCRNYGNPEWCSKTGQWQAKEAEYDDNYEVIGWARLPEPKEAS